MIVRRCDIVQYSEVLYKEFLKFDPERASTITHDQLAIVVRNWQAYGIFSDETPIGFVTFSHNILHMLIFEQWRRNWHSRDSLRQLLDLIFEDRPRIITRIEPQYPQAYRLAELVGFRYEGRVDGDYEYSLIPSERRM